MKGELGGVLQTVTKYLKTACSRIVPLQVARSYPRHDKDDDDDL